MRRLIINLQLFWQGAVLSYRALFTWLRPTTFIASMIFFPLGQIMFFTLLGIYATGAQNASFFLIGNAMQITASSGIFGVTMAVGGERWAGTLMYLFGSPANRLAIFTGRAMVHVLNGFVEVLMGLAWGWLLGWVDFSRTDPLALGLTILIATFSTAAMGLLLGCLGLITLNIMFINNLIYFLLLLFSGANVPVTSLPWWMQYISWALPLTRGIQAARNVVGGAPLTQVIDLLAGELLIGVIYLVAGYSLFRVFEAEAKRRGTLEAF
ncbi:MAG: ABC transporter permease [Chloroflexi bacterium]|nr:ABC transporter permease [Chloroflexota bacterium]